MYSLGVKTKNNHIWSFLYFDTSLEDCVENSFFVLSGRTIWPITIKLFRNKAAPWVYHIPKGFFLLKYVLI